MSIFMQSTGCQHKDENDEACHTCPGLKIEIEEQKEEIKYQVEEMKVLLIEIDSICDIYDCNCKFFRERCKLKMYIRRPWISWQKTFNQYYELNPEELNKSSEPWLVQ